MHWHQLNACCLPCGKPVPTLAATAGHTLPVHLCVQIALFSAHQGPCFHAFRQVVRRPGRDRPDVSAYLALFEHKIRDSNKLSPSEAQAVAAFLCSAVPEFAIFASKDAVLKA